LFRKPSDNAKILWMVVVLAMIADQVSKVLVESTMGLGQSVAILGDFFRLTFIRNAGGAFGIFLGGGWFYLAASAVAVAMIFFYLRSLATDQLLPRVSLAMILGGALGNLADRLRCGVVTDFLDFGFGRVRWPVFNLADAFVTVGVLLFLFSMLQRNKEVQKTFEETERSQAGQ